MQGIKEQLNRNKTILANFSYLTILQIFTILFPLITYPYLLRVVGLELYGIVIYAQTIVTYISLIINFGFNITGAKEIASNKDNPALLSEIVSSIYLNKFIIWLVCLIVYVGVINIIPFFKQHFIIYFFSFFLTFNELLFPIWFFQGIEKMKYITYINISVRLFFVLAIFIVVRQQADYVYIPLLNAIGALLGGLVASYVVFKREKICFSFMEKAKLIYYFKDSLPLFVSLSSIQIYLNINKLIVGSFLGMSEVAIYDLGEKITTLMKIPISMISQAVFPKISREKSIAFVNKVMLVAMGISVLGYIILFVTTKWIVEFFTGDVIDDAITIVRILGISAIIASANYFMGGNRLVPFGHKRTYMKVMVNNCLFFLCVIALLWLFNAITLYTITFAAIAVELFCTVSLVYHNKKLHLLY